MSRGQIRGREGQELNIREQNLLEVLPATTIGAPLQRSRPRGDDHLQ